MKEAVRKNRKIIIIILIVLIIAIAGTYAILRISVDGGRKNIITAGDLSLELKEGNNKISVSNAYPMTDEEGEATTDYSFTLKNDGDIPSIYTISLKDLNIDDGKTRMKDEYVKCKIQITGNKTEEKIIKLSELGRVLDSGTLDVNKSNHYKLQLWMDYDAPNEAQGTVFKAKLSIEGEQTIK